MIPKDRALPKNKVLYARRRRNSRAICEATIAHNSGVPWLGSVRYHELTSAGMDSIAPNKQIATGCGAVLEGGNHLLCIGDLKMLEFFAKVDCDPPAYRLLTKDPI